MVSKRYPKVDTDIVQVDPQLLFQRLTTAAAVNQQDDLKIKSLFALELCTPPASLFEAPRLMLEASKAKLLDSFPCLEEPCKPDDDGSDVVLDGGSLLHRLPWRKGDTFGQICQMYADYIARRQMYADYISRRYRKTIIVFHRYGSAPSTKDALQAFSAEHICA
jgi:hypothetical protein